MFTSLLPFRIPALIGTLLWAASVGAQNDVSVSGLAVEADGTTPVGYANAVLKSLPDSAFVTGAVTDDAGRFTLAAPRSGKYLVELSFTGYRTAVKEVFVGELNPFLEVGAITLSSDATQLAEVEVTAAAAEVSNSLDKKSYSVDDNLAQRGGSVLQAMQSLPSVTVEDGGLSLRGSDKVVVLIDGKQTALTGFGKASGLDNLPASAIERIEVITNPSSKYDANGNAGIINIVLKKERGTGLTGKVGFTGGLGSLWEREANLPSIRPQYRLTPKLNPSASLNLRRDRYNIFFQGDYLYTESLYKNEFATRRYDGGDVVRQQLKRNRNTHYTTLSAGIDYNLSPDDVLTVSGLFGSEDIIDRGDQPFFNEGLTERLRLWQFLEDELKTTVMATAKYTHAFPEPGHGLDLGFNYTFHREDERYFYDNTLANQTGTDAFKLLSDEQVYDFTADYTKPLATGRLEGGLKLRRRIIPTDMEFRPGLNSVLDSTAGGAATYRELIPAAYGSYIFESDRYEAEIGLRVEYVKLRYDVNEQHPVYTSDGYTYAQPFPSLRLGYRFDDRDKLALFGNRRVDRPEEVDIRIFPKYDDAEIVKVGNPELRPQFTNSAELGFKHTWGAGSFYAAAFGRLATNTITRIASTAPGSRIIYAIFQNVAGSSAFGTEVVLSHDFSELYSLNANASVYRNRIDAFTVVNKYPITSSFSAPAQSRVSGNVKVTNDFHLPRGIEAQLTAIYLAPDVIPQGTISSRYSVNAGVTVPVPVGGVAGELSLSATDLFGTLVTRRDVQGEAFSYTATDYNETQVVRLGYQVKF